MFIRHFTQVQQAKQCNIDNAEIERHGDVTLATTGILTSVVAQVQL